jgi:glycosidase
VTWRNSRLLELERDSRESRVAGGSGKAPPAISSTSPRSPTATGHGIGDLVGALARLDHLVWLGVDLVWLSPFYVSPLADHGYDVADHCRVDPRFGDQPHLQRAPWFRRSRSSRADPKRRWLPWTPGPGSGFTTHPRAWLPVGPRIDPNTVEVQRADENSMLHRVRELLGARRGLPDASADSVDWIGSGAVIAYRRGNVVVAMNSGSTATTLETPGAVVYSTKAA